MQFLFKVVKGLTEADTMTTIEQRKSNETKALPAKLTCRQEYQDRISLPLTNRFLLMLSWSFVAERLKSQQNRSFNGYVSDSPAQLQGLRSVA